MFFGGPQGTCCKLNKVAANKKIVAANKKIVVANKSSCRSRVCAHTDGKRATQHSCKEVRDRPARTRNVVFVVALNYQLPSSYIFALKHVF